LKELKPVDYKIVFELMVDSDRSDRKISKAIGISQPTVTRRHTRIDKDVITGYTVIPKFETVGFEISVLTFLKTKRKYQTDSAKESALEKIRDWYMLQGCVVCVMAGRGMGWDVVCVSLHKSFVDFAAFMRTQDAELSEWVVESQTFSSDLTNGVVIKPFHFKYLAALNPASRKGL